MKIPINRLRYLYSNLPQEATEEREGNPIITTTGRNPSLRLGMTSLTLGAGDRLLTSPSAEATERSSNSPLRVKHKTPSFPPE